MFESVLIPFLTVAFAELGDKSQLIILNLSSKAKNHLALLVGVVLAFSFVDGIAIFLGDWITNLVPITLLKTISGLMFIIFGLFSFRKQAVKTDGIQNYRGEFLSGFTLIFLSEWGDKTQMTAALFATKYNPIFVFIGVILSLTVLSLVAVYLGRFLFSRVSRRLVNTFSGVVFLILGVIFLLSE